MKLKSIKNLNLQDKKVLLRVLLNTPLENGKVKSDFRIRAILPTIEYLTAQNSRIILISKVKRPFEEGKVWDPDYSLRPFVAKLSELLERKLIILSEKDNKLPDYKIPHLFFSKHDIEQTDIRPLTDRMKAGDILVLENIRFYQGEINNNPDFAKKLAALGEVYINDAFGDSHSGTASHTSIVGLPELLPSAAGLNLIKEIEVLSRVIENPKPPVVLMMGGIKLSTKADVLRNFGKKTHKILLGGGVANLFLKAQGYQVGESKIEQRQIPLAKQVLRDYKDRICLPLDVVVSNSPDGRAENIRTDKVKPHQRILDIGPLTIKRYSDVLRQGKTLIWNGPLGLFEKKPFSHGTFALARLLAARSRGRAFGVAGGGETVDVITSAGLLNDIDHVSTGGGAMLDFLAGKELPGLKFLREK